MTIAGYDSRDPCNVNCPFDLGTTGTAYSLIPVGSGTTVNANIFCGVGGNPDDVIPVNGTLNGEKYALTEEPEFPVPEIPSDLPNYGTELYIDGTSTTLTPADNGVYYRILVRPQRVNVGELVIDGGTVMLGVTDFIQLEESCKITVRNGDYYQNSRSW